MVSPSDELPYVRPWLDHTDDALVACGAEWLATVWNKSARRMFGWTGEEVVGQPATLWRLVPYDRERTGRRRHLAEHGRRRAEMTVERKDGTEVAADSSAVAIREAEARIIEATRDAGPGTITCPGPRAP